MDVQTGGSVPPMKWGWRYLAWAAVPLAVGLAPARYAGPGVPSVAA